MKLAPLIWIEYFGFRLATWVVRLVPVAALYTVATVLGTVARLILWPLRRRTIRHLLFAGVASTDREAAQLADRNLINVTLTVLEILKSEQVFQCNHPPGRFATPHDELRRIARQNKGFIAVCAHYGNWEIATCMHGIESPRIHCVFRPLDNPHLNRWLARRRAAFGQSLVVKRGAARHLLRALRAKEGVGIMADQHCRRVEGTMTTFFGRPARTHTAPALLHLKTGAPLFVTGLRRTGKAAFQYEYVFRGPFEIEPTGDRATDAQALAQLYTTAIEEMIREDPTQWLWMHRRWIGVRPLQRRRQRRHRQRAMRVEAGTKAHLETQA